MGYLPTLSHKTLTKYMKYQMDLIRSQAFEVEATNREEAVALAKQAHPTLTAEFITSNGIAEDSSGIDYCEDCNKPLFDDDRYRSSSEFGVNLCGDCMPPIEDQEASCNQCDHPTAVLELKACIKCNSTFCNHCLSEGNHECMTEAVVKVEGAESN